MTRQKKCHTKLMLLQQYREIKFMDLLECKECGPHQLSPCFDSNLGFSPVFWHGLIMTKHGIIVDLIAENGELVVRTYST